MMSRMAACLVVLCALILPPGLRAQEANDGEPTPPKATATTKAASRPVVPLPTPTMRDVRYGPHERNVLDLWQAPSAKPTPLVIYIHGGGFRQGDKSTLWPRLLSECLKSGISVAAINYRFSQQAPFPAPFMDSARAVQFLRLNADKWNLDPKRFGATGGSAGAGMSLWLGFHEDMADAKSADPVLRQSTRLTCVAVQQAQTSYDPRVIRQWINAPAAEHPAVAQLYGLKPDELDTPKAHRMYVAASPINFLTADDPPVFLYYSGSSAPPAPDAPAGIGIHHPKFGQVLKERMDALKIECILRLREDFIKEGKLPGNEDEMAGFFRRHLVADK